MSGGKKKSLPTERTRLLDQPKATPTIPDDAVQTRCCGLIPSRHPTPSVERFSGDGSDDVPRPNTPIASPHADASPHAVDLNTSSEWPTTPGAFPCSFEKRTESRIKQEEAERGTVINLVRTLNREERYSIEEHEWSLGGRLQKYWCLASALGVKEKLLLTVAPLSKRCAIEMKSSKDTLNSLVSKIGKHPLFQPIHEIIYREDKVLIFQPLVKNGSLRDYLHKVNTPLKDWAEKYALKGKRSMAREEIAVCGRSILEAIRFLYLLGFPALGHIQTGNIFKTPEGYKLGGYENTLLGYKSRYHQLCLEYGNDADIIMLGHVIYEMISEGREITELILEDNSDDYRHVKDKEVKRVLKLIFSKVSSRQGVIIEELLHDDFFSQIPEERVATGYDCDLTSQEKTLLKEVKDGREKQQKEAKEKKSEKEKAADVMSMYLDKRDYSRDKINLNCIDCIGTRPGKFWGKFVKNDGKVQLLSAAEVSGDCPIVLTPEHMKTIRRFFENCKHPNLFPLDDLKFYNRQVLLVQEFQEQGSLKDSIYQTTPLSRWSDKLEAIAGHGRILKNKQIQVYAKQILIACRYLYQLGFPQLGQIHSGNIFVRGDHLRLGGFENTLLGYSAVGSDKFQRYREHLDRIMFGHVVYEMGAGTALETPIPTDSDYKKISNRAVRNFLLAVFANVHESTSSTEASAGSHVGASRGTPVKCEWTELVSHDFLRAADVKDDVTVSEDIEGILKNMLRDVRKGKPRKQWSVSQFGTTVVRNFRQVTRQATTFL